MSIVTMMTLGMMGVEPFKSMFGFGDDDSGGNGCVCLIVGVILIGAILLAVYIGQND